MEAEEEPNLQAFLRTRRESIAEDSHNIHDFGFTKAYISPGALDATMRLITDQEVIGPQDRVLDVSCGLGGASIAIAKTYGAHVLGIDMSSNMLSRADELAGQLRPEIRRKIEFQQDHAATATYDYSSFDVIFSRDTSIWTADEDGNDVLNRFYKWLRPNGRIILIDFWKSNKEPEEDERSSEASSSWNMKTEEEHREMLEKIGFERIFVNDMTEKCKDVLAEDIKSLLAAYNNSEDKDKGRYCKMIKDWQQTLFLCEYGFQKWGLIMALKP